MQQSQPNTDEFEGSSQGGLNFKPYLKAVIRNAWLVIGITIILGALGYLKSASAPPVYSSSFRVLVEPVTAEARRTDPSNLAREGYQGGDMQLDYATQLEILQSPELLDAIVEQVRVEFPGFNSFLLIQNLVVEREENTKILSVTFTGDDPDLVQRVSEEVARKFLQYSLEDRKTRIGEGVRFIEAQLPEVQDRVNTLQAQLQNLQQTYSLIDPEAEGGQIAGQVQDLSVLQFETQRELAVQQSLYTNLQQQLGLSPNEAIAASVLSENPGYQTILDELQTINTQIAIESARFSENSPPIQALRERQANLTALLNIEAQRVIGPSLAQVTDNDRVLAFQNTIRRTLTQQLVDTANQIQMLQARSQEIASNQRLLEGQLRQFPEIVRQYADLQRQLEISTRTLDQLLSQRETLRVEAAQNQVPWEILSDPGVPLDEDGDYAPEPSDPKILLLGVMAGLAFGAGAAILLEKIRDIFYEPDDINDVVQYPLLGVIPICPSLKRTPFLLAIDPSTLNSREHRRASEFLESFSSLYASIRFLASDPPVQSLVISSPSPGDGNSVVALHLAQTVAAMGQRVLLVDANFRLPCLHHWLELSNFKGLNEVLRDRLRPEDIIQASPLQNNLFVLTAGQVQLDSPKLLASPQMADFAAHIHPQYDLVLYDAPQLLGIMDTTFLSAHTDGVLLTVSLKQTKCSATAQVIRDLEKYMIPVLGVVANRAKSAGHSKNHYGKAPAAIDLDEDEVEELSELDRSDGEFDLDESASESSVEHPLVHRRRR